MASTQLLYIMPLEALSLKIIKHFLDQIEKCSDVRSLYFNDRFLMTLDLNKPYTEGEKVGGCGCVCRGGS